MRECRVQLRNATIIALGLALAGSPLGCSKKKKTDETAASAAASAEPTVDLAKLVEVTPEEKARAEKMVTGLRKNATQFPRADLSRQENAKLFTYLAGTHEESRVVLAALHGMQQTYSAHSKRKTRPDQAFVEVVKKNLASKDDQVVAGALLAAGVALGDKTFGAEMLDQVAKLAERYPDGPGRYALVSSLRNVGRRQKDDRVTEILVDSLKAEQPYVLSRALQTLARSRNSELTELKARALELTKHKDPGVRGRALRVLAAVAKNADESRTAVLAALKDPHPYVRSEAANSLGRMGHRPAIHELIKLVDDKEANQYVIEGWTTMRGRPGHLRHDGSPNNRVGEAAMTAIRNLSRGKLKLERVQRKNAEADLDKNAAATKAWYDQNKADIDKADSEAADSDKAEASGDKPMPDTEQTTKALNPAPQKPATPAPKPAAPAPKPPAPAQAAPAPKPAPAQPAAGSQ